MCQTNVFIENNGESELLYENVTTLEVIENGYMVTTLFEGEQEVTDVVLEKIDFAGGKVYLQKN